MPCFDTCFFFVIVVKFLRDNMYDHWTELL